MASIYYLGVDGNWTNTANWSGGSVPVSTDDVFIANSSQDIITNLNQSAVALASLTIDATYTGKIGAASTYLQIDATTLTIGRQTGNVNATGSSRLHLKGTYTTAVVLDTAVSSADTGYPPLCFAGTITTLHVRGGSVGIAVLTPTETATATTINITQSSSAQVSPVVTMGSVTNTTINLDSGILTSRASATCTTANVRGGTYRVEGTNAHTTATVEGGSLVYNGTGTITNLIVYSATADFSNDTRAKTITNCNAYKGATLRVDTGVSGSVTLTNGVVLHGCDLGDVTLRFGNDRTITVA